MLHDLECLHLRLCRLEDSFYDVREFRQPNGEVIYATGNSVPGEKFVKLCVWYVDLNDEDRVYSGFESFPYPEQRQMFSFEYLACGKGPYAVVVRSTPDRGVSKCMVAERCFYSLCRNLKANNAGIIVVITETDSFSNYLKQHDGVLFWYSHLHLIASVQGMSVLASGSDKLPQLYLESMYKASGKTEKNAYVLDGLNSDFPWNSDAVNLVSSYNHHENTQPSSDDSYDPDAASHASYNDPEAASSVSHDPEAASSVSHDPEAASSVSHDPEAADSSDDSDCAWQLYLSERNFSALDHAPSRAGVHGHIAREAVSPGGFFPGE